MSKHILHGDEARDKLQEGINLVANTVKKTLGPKGRNVTIDTDPFRNPLNTNDGVTIAREVDTEDTMVRVGVRLVKEVAGKTNDVAGDGTTTASLLVQNIANQALEAINDGADPVALRSEIESAASRVAVRLRNQKIETNDLASLESIATISSGDETLGKLIAGAVFAVGADGIVTIEDSDDDTTKANVTEGIELRGGYVLPMFVTVPARQEADLSDVPIFVTDHDLTNGIEVIKIMEVCSQNNFKQAVIIANNISGEALATCVVNKMQQKFNLTPIRVIAWGEQGQGVLRDMAAATGAKFFSKEEGYKLAMTPEQSYDFDMFGSAKRVVATKDRTTIIGAGGDVDARIDELTALRKNAKKGFEQDAITERIAKLRSGVGVISVGGITETEREERKLRVEDAINASKAALGDGVVIGGGAALWRAVDKLWDDDPKPGEKIVYYACQKPIFQMAENSSITLSEEFMQKVTDNENMTIDFRTGELVDGKEEGIIDPLKVVESALLNAASAAGVIITTEAIITQDQEA